MNTIVFPIRFDNNALATHEENTDSYYNQLISIAMQISPGEVPLDIDFGIKDLTFTDMSESSIKQAIAYYFPEIDVTRLRVVQDVSTSNYIVDIAYTY